MHSPARTHHCTAALLAASAVLFLAGPAFAQQLAVRRYGVGEGLPQSVMFALHRDPHGYLWVGIPGAVARFDGEQFRIYGPRHGVAPGDPLWMADDRQGRLWISSRTHGLVRLRETPVRDDGTGARLFQAYAMAGIGEESLEAFLFDADGHVWCLTNSGLFRGRPTEEGVLALERMLPARFRGAKGVKAATTDAQGSLWFGVADQVVRVRRDVVDVFEPSPGNRGRAVAALLARGERMVAGYADRLSELDVSGEAPRWTDLPVRMGGARPLGAAAASGESVLMGTDAGLLEITGDRQRWLTHANGLPADGVHDLVLDGRGGAWIATANGLAHIRWGIESLTVPEGMPASRVWRLVEAADGRVYGTTDVGLFELGENRARRVPGSEQPPFYTVQRAITQGPAGEWWLGTHAGVYRIPGPALDFARARALGPSDGFPDDAEGAQYTRGLLADPDGSVWLALSAGRVVRVVPRPAGGFAGEVQPLPDTREVSPVRAFARDGRGALWAVGRSSLFRRRGGAWTRVAIPWTEAIPSGPLLVDREQRLWVGTQNGAYTAPTAADEPRFTYASPGPAVGDASVWCVAEDRAGRKYLGTDHGVQRIDPTTGRSDLLTTAHGLVNDAVIHCLSDKRGRVWFATHQGVSRVDPRRQPANTPVPPVRMERLVVGGQEVPLPPRGATSTPAPRLAHDANTLEAEFTAPSLEYPGDLRYQTKFDGLDSDWSEPRRGGRMQFSRLAAGGYRVLVRAVAVDGSASGDPFALSFRVVPPFWRQWWFLALVFGAVVAGAMAFHRFRLERDRAIERMRRQVASDLHDEVGSGLGGIGILAGVAAEGEVDEAERKTLAGQIVQSAAELGTALSDIVWFLRPGSSSMQGLADRLLERARALFPGESPAFEARLPPTGVDAPLALDVARNVYLIALEALHNAARHARARHVWLDLSPEGTRWRVGVTDDGQGLPRDAGDRRAGGGLGLVSMRSRAEAIGADLQWSSPSEGGTAVTLRFDPGARLRRRRQRVA